MLFLLWRVWGNTDGGRNLFWDESFHLLRFFLENRCLEALIAEVRRCWQRSIQGSLADARCGSLPSSRCPIESDTCPGGPARRTPHAASLQRCRNSGKTPLSARVSTDVRSNSGSANTVAEP